MTLSLASVDAYATTAPAEPVVQVSRIVRALERAWETIAAGVPELPEVAIVVATGTEELKAKRWGHFAASRWVGKAGERRGEVLIAAERLACGPVEVLGTLVHEAAHALAAARGIKDTSRQGRYHNERYKLIAEELGLVVAKDDRYGWTVTRLTDAAVDAYRATLDDLDVAIVAFRQDPTFRPATPPGPTDTDADADADAEPAEPKEKRGGGERLLLVCACAIPRKLRVSPATLAEGSISCGACGADFELAITV